MGLIGIDDIMSVVKKGPQLASKLDGYKINMKSVAKGASDATFQFPCIFEDTIPVDMMGAISRKTELTYATFTQLMLGLNPVIDITKDRSVVQYLKNFHQNVKLETVMNELIAPENEVTAYMEGVQNGDYTLFMTHDRSFGVLFNTLDRGTSAMMESHRELLKEYLSDFDLVGFPITEANSDYTNSGDFAQAVLDSQNQKREKNERDFAQKTTQQLKPPVNIKDIDVKKTNDMMPFALQVRLMAVNDKNQFVQYIDFVLGIKTIMHSVSSDEIIDNIVRAMKNRSLAFKFLRWTTGEISLFKNIILNMDEIKADALDRQSKKNPLLSKLKQLKKKKFGLHDFSVPHGIIPNATLVVSSYSVDYIKNTYGIDLKNPSEAKKLVSSLFLMTFMIVDDGSGIIEILYDDGTGYQTYTLESLERDMAMNSNKLGREIGRMIAH